MNIGMQIGGLQGKNGQAVITALRMALNEAIRRGQNDVAKTLAVEIAKLGATTGSTVSGCTFQG